tara:strand:+ start:561 stop:893 length:333 start_codon:yes stop_codon:yes gene_type:complete
MNVSLVSQSTSFSVRLKPEDQKIKVATIQGGVQVPAEFGDLEDFDATDVKDKSIIMYNAATGKYEAVNVDEVLSAAATETESPGLPDAFIDALDTDLTRDSNIDIDGGTF